MGLGHATADKRTNTLNLESDSLCCTVQSDLRLSRFSGRVLCSPSPSHPMRSIYSAELMNSVRCSDALQMHQCLVERCQAAMHDLRLPRLRRNIESVF